MWSREQNYCNVMSLTQTPVKYICDSSLLNLYLHLYIYTAQYAYISLCNTLTKNRLHFLKYMNSILSSYSISVNCHAGNIFALFWIFVKFQDTFLNLRIFYKPPPANSHFMASFSPHSHEVALLPHRAQGGPQGWEQTFVSSMFRGLWIGHDRSIHLQCICAGEKSTEFSEADETHGSACCQKFSFVK